MDPGQSLQLVKCYLTDNERVGEIRKFVIEKKDAASFSVICGKVRALYPQLKDQAFCVFYIDEDGDKIVISSDEELLAYQVTNKEAVMKFNIELIGTRRETAKAPGKVTEELGSCKGNLHEGVVCDVCDSRIRGFRYKCMKCPDYDLCGRCEAAGNHPGHMMARVSGPLDQFPKVFRAVRGEDGSWLAQGQKWGRRVTQRCEARRAGEARGADKGQQQWPPHVNFNFRVPGRMAARNVGQESEKEYLMNVGSVLASHLESLGIDTHVDVHTETSGNVHCYPSGGCQKSPEEEHRAAAGAAAVAIAANQAAAAAAEAAVRAAAPAAAVAASQAVAAAEAATRAAADTAVVEREYWDAWMPENETSTTTVDEPENWDATSTGRFSEESVAEAEEPENWDSPAAVNSLGVQEVESQDLPAKTPTSDSGEWTIVDGTKHDDKVATVSDSSSQAEAVTPEPTALGEKPTDGQNGLYPNLNSLEPIHPDAKIAAALESMLAMGFTNEGGWLSQLLEVKGGDIGKVMDVLHGTV